MQLILLLMHIIHYCNVHAGPEAGWPWCFKSNKIGIWWWAAMSTFSAVSYSHKVRSCILQNFVHQHIQWYKWWWVTVSSQKAPEKENSRNYTAKNNSSRVRNKNQAANVFIWTNRAGLFFSSSELCTNCNTITGAWQFEHLTVIS